MGGEGDEGVWGLSLSQPGAVPAEPQLHPNTMRPSIVPSQR